MPITQTQGLISYTNDQLLPSLITRSCNQNPPQCIRATESTTQLRPTALPRPTRRGLLSLSHRPLNRNLLLTTTRNIHSRLTLTIFTRHRRITFRGIATLKHLKIPTSHILLLNPIKGILTTLIHRPLQSQPLSLLQSSNNNRNKNQVPHKLVTTPLPRYQTRNNNRHINRLHIPNLTQICPNIILRSPKVITPHLVLLPNTLIKSHRLRINKISTQLNLNPLLGLASNHHSLNIRNILRNRHLYMLHNQALSQTITTLQSLLLLQKTKISNHQTFNGITLQLPITRQPQTHTMMTRDRSLIIILRRHLMRILRIQYLLILHPLLIHTIRSIQSQMNPPAHPPRPLDKVHADPINSQGRNRFSLRRTKRSQIHTRHRSRVNILSHIRLKIRQTTNIPLHED